MKTGLKGAFVISWTQTELDGLWAAPKKLLRVGAAWRWTGEALRVDGPRDVLALGVAEGEADLRRRAATSARRLIGSIDGVTVAKTADPIEEDPLFDASFTITDGHATWMVTLIETVQGGRPLLMFVDEIPPREKDLWIVSHNVELGRRDQATDPAGGVICFTPGTMILTELGPRPVDDLGEGDRIQTKDDGCQEVLWMGRRRITGARLYAMPNLAPIRLIQGALGEDIPDAGLLVSPDHRIVVKGEGARNLFNTDEVLVAARDLVNDNTVFIDNSVREVTYIHMLLPQHQVVFANGVETESYHPASASLSTITPDERARLMQAMPDVFDDASTYGSYARRSLSASEAAILSYSAA
jgi:hypothetical protein